MAEVLINLPALDCDEIDEAYWKRICEFAGGSHCPVTEPYQAMCERVLKIKKALEEWEQKPNHKHNQEEALRLIKVSQECLSNHHHHIDHVVRHEMTLCSR